MLLFLWLGFIASNVFGSYVYLLMLFVALVSLVKVLRGRESMSERFHDNSYR